MENNQIALLKKYGVDNYTINNGQITINGDLYLNSLAAIHKDFLKETTINGTLHLNSLKTMSEKIIKKLKL